LSHRYGKLPLRAADRICIAYTLTLSASVVVFRGRVDHWQVHGLCHLALAVLALEVVRAHKARPEVRALAAIRVFYPIAAILYTYLSLDDFQDMWFGAYHFSDDIVRADQAIFGVHPTAWVQRLYGGPLDEVFSFFYLTYYAIPIAIAIPWFRRGQSNRILIVGAAVTFTYAMNFVIFLLIPALGPRHIDGLAALHHSDYGGAVFGWLARSLQGSGGTIDGGVFPSAHVSATAAWAIATYRFDRRLAALAAVCTAGIALATVYLGYHHGIDPIAGLALALACAPAGLWLARRENEVPR
jgi:membrane-associated phospholipid phosphatase